MRRPVYPVEHRRALRAARLERQHRARELRDAGHDAAAIAAALGVHPTTVFRYLSGRGEPARGECAVVECDAQRIAGRRVCAGCAPIFDRVRAWLEAEAELDDAAPVTVRWITPRADALERAARLAAEQLDRLDRGEQPDTGAVADTVAAGAHTLAG